VLLPVRGLAQKPFADGLLVVSCGLNVEAVDGLSTKMIWRDEYRIERVGRCLSVSASSRQHLIREFEAAFTAQSDKSLQVSKSFISLGREPINLAGGRARVRYAPAAKSCCGSETSLSATIRLHFSKSSDLGRYRAISHGRFEVVALDPVRTPKTDNDPPTVPFSL